MDISSLVRNVVAAFDDAVNLVRRIQDRKDVKDDPQAMADLVTSLSLGPVVIRGYFDSDVKRFGDAYTAGDQLAREQLKDVLISLQMSLLTTLRTVLLDEQELDYNTLLETSDSCRVNAGVCLGQLSQRLTEHARFYAQTPPAYVSGGAFMGGLQHTASSATYSSSGTTRSPKPNVAQFAKLDLNGQSGPVRPQDLNRDSYDSWGSDKRVHNDQDPETRSMRRPSSHTLAPDDLSLISPSIAPSELANQDHVAPDALPGAQNLTRESYVTLGGLPTDSGHVREASNGNVSTQPTQLGRHQSRARFGPDDYSPVNGTPQMERNFSFASSYQRQPSIAETRQNSVTSYANRAYGSGLETMASLNSVPEFPQYLVQSPVQETAFPNGYSFQQQTFPNARSESYSQQSVISPRQHIPPPYPPIQPDPNDPLYTGQQRPSVSAPIPVSSEQDHYQQQPANVISPQASFASVISPQASFASFGSPQVQFATPTRQRTDSAITCSDPRSPSLSTAAPTAPRPVPQFSVSSTTNSLQHTNTNMTHASIASAPRSISAAPSGPLILPTEKNTLGLCKGAFRLFIGMEKKAFDSAARPSGYSGYSTIQHWRCAKCNFEGPMAHITRTPPGGKKPKTEKCFDRTIREMYGVRYRWAFLAKSHVHLKQIPPEGASRKNGTFGSYGCLFCAAESHLRNWGVASAASVHNASVSDGSSTRSGSSAGLSFTTSSNSNSSASGGSKDQAPIFGNLQSFMEHLHKHRTENWWPNPEMQGRLKCIVGRVAESAEDFEINLMPLSATNGA